MRLVIITGMSGAGRTQALRMMEDMRYYCMDNIPPLLIPSFVKLCEKSRDNVERVAMVMDTRGMELFGDVFAQLEELRKEGYVYELLFLDAGDEALIKRYKETRRVHPLMREGGSLLEGIRLERERLTHVRNRAELVVDTSQMLVRELVELLDRHYNRREGGQNGAFRIQAISFGFKRGIPLEADLVFDVRFLPNPFYVEALRPYSGLTPQIQEFLNGFPETQDFLRRILELLLYLCPFYKREGKRNLVVAMGCTGGMHRSVALTDMLAGALCGQGMRVDVQHRDLRPEGERIHDIEMQAECGNGGHRES